jgi:monoamine oxidase
MAAMGGAGAAIGGMNALDMTPSSAQVAPPELTGSGSGKKVIVLGGGPGGCPTAYELMQLGYDVTLLEAADYLGGHAFTVKGGTKVHELGGEPQECDWDEGHWYDAGPSRIPHYHRGILHYCKALNVPMIDHKNIDLNCWIYLENIDGPLNKKKLRVRELQADMAGYTSELLAKAADQGNLDEPFTNDDHDALIEYLVRWGLISRDDLTYRGSENRGFALLPDTVNGGSESEPIPFKDLLPFARATLGSQSGYLAAAATRDWQATLMHPRDGMQSIYDVGFRNALGDRVKLNSKVTEIRQSESGVRIVYTDTTTGQSAEITGDYCVCNIPLSVLMHIPADFSSDMQTAIQSVPYAMAGRAGAQFKRRFWEEDDWIYGGQTFTNFPKLNIIGYPDSNYHAEKGVLLVYYNTGINSGEISGYSLAERQEFALSWGEKIHPTYRQDFESMISVHWHRMEHTKGAWPSFPGPVRQTYFPRLQEPDGRIYLVGEHLSNLNAWQEGAFQAAWMQVEKLHKRAMSEA